jgi:Tfp pilus assembly protein PilN
MMRVDLLPREVLEQRRARKLTSVLVLGAVGWMLLLGGFWAYRNMELGRQQQRLEEAQAESRTLETQVAALQEFAVLEKTVKEKQQTLSTVMAGDVAWSRLLVELSMIIPGEAWLTSFSGQATPPQRGQPATATEPAPGQPTGKLGNLNFSGTTFDFPDVAKWITRLSELKSLQNVWVPSAAKTEIGAREVVNFSSTADLSQASASERYQAGG